VHYNNLPIVELEALEMPDAEALKAKILSQRRDLTEEELNRLIEEKKRQIGAGYLTDAGACWLIASELGVTLEEKVERGGVELTPSAVQIGLSEVTVRGRVLSAYATKTYSRKDGTTGRYRRLVIFDKESFLPVTLWDEAAESSERLQIKAGSLIRIVKGYVKAGLDGRPALHVGRRGYVETLPEDEGFTTLDEISRDVADVKGAERNLVIKGVVDSEPKHSEFARKEGLGTVTQFYLKGRGERRVRVVLWDISQEVSSKIRVGEGVLIAGVRSKTLPNGEIELHGDEATTIIPYEVAVSRRILRLVSKGSQAQAEGAATILLLDKSGQAVTYLVKGDALQIIKETPYDTLIEVASQRSVLSTASDLRIVKEDEGTIPKTANLLIKVKDVKGGSDKLFLKVIALTKPSAQDIYTKEGVSVKKTELIVGDETGEIRLNAWRELHEKLINISPGERLLLRGVASQVGRDGAPYLTVRAYSDVEKLK
jgi:replication factor A1